MPPEPHSPAQSTEEPPPAPGGLTEREVFVVRPDGERIRLLVEIADEEPERRRGLMYRRHLAPDAGMLFVFEEMERLSFWMENTLVALDVLFIDDQHEIVGIVTDTVPLSRDPIEVERPSRYVLEVNAGFAAAHGIAPGARLELGDPSPEGEAP